MKTILCFGDSNTWGYNPENRQRFGPEERWSGILRNSLGEDYRAIEEGLNGRTTLWDDPIEGFKNGLDYLMPCLESHKPFDLITIMLGTNDLKCRFRSRPLILLKVWEFWSVRSSKARQGLKRMLPFPC